MSKSSRLRLVIGIAIVATLLVALIPQYNAMMLKSRESTLQLNLLAMRDAIKQYTKDKQQAPRSLRDLVDAGYFREMPVDPITHSSSSWMPVLNPSGITDVRSGATDTSSKGTAYSTW